MRKGKLITAVLIMLLSSCVNRNSSLSSSSSFASGSPVTSMNERIYKSMNEDELIQVGSRKDRGFIVDNVYNDPTQGVIHFSSYFPDSYDGSSPFALFVTDPGWEGEYPQGLGNNLGESFPHEARKYVSDMIILSTQLYDWGRKSADDTIALVEHFLNFYNIDRQRVYGHGYSGGGETMSLVLSKRPELYKRVLVNSTRWDGDASITEARTALYLAVGENDSYYGSSYLKDAYQLIYNAYKEKGLSEEEIRSLLVLDVKPDSYFHERGYQDTHAGGNAFGEDTGIMSWLFKGGEKQ